MHTVYAGTGNAPDDCADWPNSMDPPTLSGTWAEKVRGHNATWSLSGTYPAFFSGCAQGIWTSAPLRVRKPGKVATVVLKWSALQLDPIDHSNDQTVYARYTDVRGRWGSWVPYFKADLSTPLDAATVHAATVGIVYRGPLPRRDLRVQVKIEDRLTIPMTQLTQTAQITA